MVVMLTIVLWQIYCITAECADKISKILETFCGFRTNALELVMLSKSKKSFHCQSWAVFEILVFEIRI